MQSITVNTVQDIIKKSQLAYPKTEDSNVICGSAMNLDDVLTIPVEESVLEETVAALTKEELAELAAIMHLGSGFNGEVVEDFSDLVADALGQYHEGFAYYISSKTLLADDLKSGLTKLGLNYKPLKQD